MHIFERNDSDSPRWIGESDTRTLTASNIPTLTMQIGLCDGGYVGANDYPDGFISNNKTIGMESATYSGDTSDVKAYLYTT